MEFRDKCLKNDEKLRLIFKVDLEEEAREQEAIAEAPQGDETAEEEDEEVITLNPNNLYESSDESEVEDPEEQVVQEPNASPPLVVNSRPPPQRAMLPAHTANDLSKKEIFHCRYCDVVFSDSVACNVHELKNHNQTYPYECTLCPYKTEQHATLIFHIKQTHNHEKPFLCAQCSKSFIRRSDLRKHTFVHAGKFHFLILSPPLTVNLFKEFGSSPAMSATNHLHGIQTSPSTRELTLRSREPSSALCVRKRFTPIKSCRVTSTFIWIERR